MSAHEDHQIRVFDLNSNKLIHTLYGHHDAVTDLACLNSSGNIISVSHDGSLREWDIRKFTCVNTIDEIHLSKYDETIHSVVAEENSHFIFTGGADGLINIFEKFD